MVPRISVRRQNRFGVAVAIERLRGRQYRCLVCNTVFYELDELDAHVRREAPRSRFAGGPALRGATAPADLLFERRPRKLGRKAPRSQLSHAARAIQSWVAVGT